MVKHLTFHMVQALEVLVAEVLVDHTLMVLAQTALLIKAEALAVDQTHLAVMMAVEELEVLVLLL